MAGSHAPRRRRAIRALAVIALTVPLAGALTAPSEARANIPRIPFTDLGPDIPAGLLTARNPAAVKTQTGRARPAASQRTDDRRTRLALAAEREDEGAGKQRRN